MCLILSAFPHHHLSFCEVYFCPSGFLLPNLIRKLVILTFPCPILTPQPPQCFVLPVISSSTHLQVSGRQQFTEWPKFLCCGDWDFRDSLPSYFCPAALTFTKQIIQWLLWRAGMLPAFVSQDGILEKKHNLCFWRGAAHPIICWFLMHQQQLVFSMWMRADTKWENGIVRSLLVLFTSTVFSGGKVVSCLEAAIGLDPVCRLLDKPGYQ